MDMEHWRKFFATSNADLWTIIEQAINLAATDYSKAFKEKRGDIAEVLFARNPFDAMNDSLNLEQQPNVTEDSEAMAVAKSGKKIAHISSVETQKMLGDDVTPETSLINQVNHIKQVIRNGDQSEGTLLELLQKLEDKRLTATELKVTEIGKEVNILRRHSSQNVRAAAKSLVKHWKFKIDEWLKTVRNDAAAGVTSPATLADSPARGTREAASMLEKGHSCSSNAASALSASSNPSWEPTELFSLIDRDTSGDGSTLEDSFVNVKASTKGTLHGSKSGSVVTALSDSDARANSVLTCWEVRTTPGEMGSATRDCSTFNETFKPNVDLCTSATVRPVYKSTVPDDAKGRPIKQLMRNKLNSRQVEEKLEVAKRKLHEGYQQAENAKKQRTIQVLDFPDLPRTCETGLGKAHVAAQSKSHSKSGAWAQSKRLG